MKSLSVLLLLLAVVATVHAQTNCWQHTDTSTRETCESNNCFYDIFLHKCFFSMAHVQSLYNCSRWSGLELKRYNATAACLYHECVPEKVNISIPSLVTRIECRDGIVHSRRVANNIILIDDDDNPESRTYRRYQTQTAMLITFLVLLIVCMGMFAYVSYDNQHSSSSSSSSYQPAHSLYDDDYDFGLDELSGSDEEERSSDSEDEKKKKKSIVTMHHSRSKKKKSQRL